MRIGARGSDLAQWQARWVADKLAAAGIATEQVIIKTTGDRVQDRPLHQIGVQGAFTAELEVALAEDRIDLAVHSFKDMALLQPNGLEVVAVSERADPADWLVLRNDRVDPGRGEIPLPQAAVVGTSAIRRGSQLQALRPDVTLKDLRGNVPTRLGKLADGMYDAIFLAAAGTKRLDLDLTEFHVVELDPARFIPSPAQGALAVEMRADDPRCGEVKAAVHHPLTAVAVKAERALLKGYGGGCSLPLGGHAVQENGVWTLHGFWGGDGGPAWESVTAASPATLSDTLLTTLPRPAPADG